jgi:uncharacterized protein
MPEPIVVVMAKAPRAGEVKTRLLPSLTPAEAASLAASFVRDTVKTAKEIVANVLIAYAPADARIDLEPILPMDLLWFQQQGDNLGERLHSVATHVATLGFTPALILGADSPDMPIAFLREALDVLTAGQADVALGPTQDGGYYLVGLRSPVPGLFNNIAWSTSSAYRQTSDNAVALNLRLHVLPGWYDVDTPGDLDRLRSHATDEQMQLRAPNTYDWLVDHKIPST